jgi:tetratricopeptide (TPR) repeat protein
MPSHIYIRTGRYHDGVLANQRSVSVDSGYTAMCHANGIYPLGYFPHNIHFLSTCATMEGNSALAWNSALELREHVVKDLLTDPNWSTMQHFQAFPYLVAVKLDLWDKLKDEAKPDSAWKYASALWHFAQGMRMIHEGHPDLANEHLEGIKAGAQDSSVIAMRIWGINPATSILAVAQRVLEGELMLAQGRTDAGLEQLTEAVAAEDSLQYQEPRDWSFPSRHELGAALLKARRFAEAEAVYERDLLDWPENGYALIGLRSALTGEGNRDEATALDARIKQAFRYADRPDLLGMR